MNSYPDQPEMVELMPYLEYVASLCASIIEIGIGHGNGSTRAFSRGLKRSQCIVFYHVLVDCNQDNLAEVDLFPWMHLIHGNSEDPKTVERFVSMDHMTPDLIYIDTHHTYEQLKAELEVWSAVAKPDTTMWLFHDTWMFGCYNSMVEAIHEFCAAHPEWRYHEITKDSHGLGMMIGADREFPPFRKEF